MGKECTCTCDGCSISSEMAELIETDDPAISKYKKYTPQRILRLAFTGKDNVTVDIGRVLWAIGAVAYIAISSTYVWLGGDFNALEWGAGFAAVNGGSGAAIRLKEKGEPQADDSLREPVID